MPIFLKTTALDLISSFFQKAASAVKTVAKRHPYKWVPKSAAGVDNFRRFLHKVSKWL
jgi:hypothetical protein